MMFKPRNTEERQRRLMGPLLLIFDYLHGKSWVTWLGIIIFVGLVVMSFLPVSE
ncbi:MAG: hypothetical protein ACON4P_06145 [Candidatus Puniceispirillales bacterium]